MSLSVVEMAEVRDEVRSAAPASEPSEEEIHSPDSETRSRLRRARERSDFQRMQSALDDVLPDVFAARFAGPEATYDDNATDSSMNHR